jgi:predicted transcriptional regulator
MAEYTIALKESSDKLLTEIARRRKIKKERLLVKAIEHYLFMVEIERLRPMMRQKAKELGINSEEDIYNMIS